MLHVASIAAWLGLWVLGLVRLIRPLPAMYSPDAFGGWMVRFGEWAIVIGVPFMILLRILARRNLMRHKSVR